MSGAQGVCLWLVGMDMAHEGSRGMGLRHTLRASAGPGRTMAWARGDDVGVGSWWLWWGACEQGGQADGTGVHSAKLCGRKGCGEGMEARAG